jgi:hypothetical protein
MRIALPVALTLLAACQEPFGTDRHDLVGDRIFAVTVDPPGAASGTFVHPQAVLLVDGRPWSDDAVELAWAWDADTDALLARLPGEGAAIGPTPTLRVPERHAILGLVASFPSGAVARAYIDLPRSNVAAIPDLPAFADARVLAADDVVPLDATPDGPAPRLRWMTIDGRGTVVETTRTTADLLVAEVTFDDGEEVSRTALTEGAITVFGLAVSDDGATRLRGEDLWLGAPPEGAFLADGRFLPSDVALPTGRHRVTLAADDAAPWGLRATSATSTTDPADLDLAALVTGEVLRGDLVGADVVVEVP